MEERRKTDNLIWYFMITSISVIILGGGAWANSINAKVEKIVGLEATVLYIQKDVLSIKQLLFESFKK